jgi:cell division transport system permease protein
MHNEDGHEMSALRYAVDEALSSLWRGRQSGMLSTVTIALALFVLGGFLLLTSNLQRLGAAWSSAAEMSVYLKDGVSPAERGAIENVLVSAGIATGREYVSKDSALTRFKQAFGDLALAVDTAGDNPLPASYEVRLRTASDDRANVESLAARLRPMAGVADVRYDRQWLDRLEAAIAVIRGVGLVLGSVLTIAAALTVGNVVRLALHARRDELEIMQLVGAPQVYIRGPFVMEGILQGGTGAALALVALLMAFALVRVRYLVPLASTIDISSVRFLPVELCVLVVVGGMLVGCVGGLVAARNS